MNFSSFFSIKIKNTRPDGVNICLDTLQRDEHANVHIGMFFCQSGSSSAQVLSSKNLKHHK